MTNAEAQMTEHLITTLTIEGKKYHRKGERVIDTLKRLFSDYENSRELTKLLLKERYIKIGDKVVLIEIPQSEDFNWLDPDKYPLEVGKLGIITWIASTELVVKIKWNDKKCSKYDNITFFTSHLKVIIK